MNDLLTRRRNDQPSFSILFNDYGRTDGYIRDLLGAKAQYVLSTTKHSEVVANPVYCPFVDQLFQRQR